jgi:hypothetical protein
MIAAVAVAWLGLAAGAAPVPTGYELVPKLKLGVGMEAGVAADELAASPWADPSERAAESRFIEREVNAAPPIHLAPAATLYHSPSRRKSPPLALALTLICTIPTVFVGPSMGHLYAGDWKHFLISGGGRLTDLTLLVILEKWAPGFGIGPLVALFNPEHLGKDFSGYPVGYPVDLVLVLALVASTIYDAVDSWRAAARFNEKLDQLGLAPPQPMSPAAAAAVPPPARP